jgi:transmembrane sensor
LADQNSPNNPPAAPDGELLDRYLAGETTEAETAMVRRYFMAHPDAARRLQRHLDAIEAAESRPAPPGAESLARLRERMKDPPSLEGAVAPSSSVRTRQRPNSKQVMRYALAAAAVLVVAVALSFGPQAVVRHRLAAGGVAPRMYATAPRERAELLLSDGTRVRLAPGSRLRIDADFGVDRRDVQLDGLAYFDVVHDRGRPFTVFAGNASAMDLGTQFVVRAYPEDSAVQVAVRSGAVVLSGVGRLGSGDVGQLQSDGHVRRWHTASMDSLLDLFNGRLAYRDAPLGRVLQDIHRWYDLDARVADPTIAALPFTGVLTEESSGAVIDRVAATLGLTVAHDSTGVVLHAVAGRTPRAGTSMRRRARLAEPSPIPERR